MKHDVRLEMLQPAYREDPLLLDTLLHPLSWDPTSASMGAAEAHAFLEYQAVERHVTVATQNQALNALIFLYRHVLEQPLGDIGTFSRQALAQAAKLRLD